ncbi:MAG: HD domain-containing protein [Patescibacteria group bacterium]|nr:HD domain-containing protein [Patescibacteria group bacterium]
MESEIGKFNFSEGKDLLFSFEEWKLDPSKFEGKNTLTSPEYGAIINQLESEFSSKVRDSGLSDPRRISENDLDLIHQLQDRILQIEKSIIPDEERRPFNLSSLSHVHQVETVARVIAENINKTEPNLRLNPLLVGAKAAIHDMGRFASHEAVIHGMAGRELLKRLGFDSTFVNTTLAHLEAGSGPGVINLDENNIGTLSDQEIIDWIDHNIDPAEIIVTLADLCSMGAKDEQSGKYQNHIVYPLESLVHSASRRPVERRNFYFRLAGILIKYVEKMGSVDISNLIPLAKERYEKEFPEKEAS